MVPPHAPGFREHRGDKLATLTTVNTQFSSVFFCSIALRETIDRTELMGICNCICYNSLKTTLKTIVSMDRNHMLEEPKRGVLGNHLVASSVFFFKKSTRIMFTVSVLGTQFQDKTAQQVMKPRKGLSEDQYPG